MPFWNKWGIWVLLGSWGVFPSLVWGQGVTIESIVLSKNCIETRDSRQAPTASANPDCPQPGDIQLIQVSLFNSTSEALNVGVQIEVSLNGKRTPFNEARKTELLRPQGIVRVLAAYPIPTKSGGRFHVSAKVYDARFKTLLASSSGEVNREFYTYFRPPAKPSRPSKAGSGGAESGRVTGNGSGIAGASRNGKPLQFDPPDLEWTQILVVPRHTLRGEKFKIRLDLKNTGGDVARKIQGDVAYYNIKLPRRRLPIATPLVDVIAPGETVTFEVEYTWPEDELLGEYQVIATADVTNMISESKEDNNEMLSELIKLSDIKLLIPADQFTFDEKGLFLFQWDSALYTEFKVQIGIDDKFEEPANFFDLPQGNRWVADKELAPLAGELPLMAQGLMKTFKRPSLFWRVVGRRADGKQAFSDAFRFSIQGPTKPEASTHEKSETSHEPKSAEH